MFFYRKYISSKSTISVLTISSKSRNIKIIAPLPLHFIINLLPPHFKIFFPNTHAPAYSNLPIPLQLNTEELLILCTGMPFSGFPNTANWQHRDFFLVGCLVVAFKGKHNISWFLWKIWTEAVVCFYIICCGVFFLDLYCKIYFVSIFALLFVKFLSENIPLPDALPKIFHRKRWKNLQILYCPNFTNFGPL